MLLLHKRIYLVCLIIAFLINIAFQNILKTDLYKKLLTHSDFEPCHPVGCKIDIQGNSNPVCFQGKCSPCRRDGECVLGYRVYMDQLHSKAKCNKLYGTCSKS